MACAPFLGEKGKGLLSGNSSASSGHRNTDWHHPFKALKTQLQPLLGHPDLGRGAGLCHPPTLTEPQLQRYWSARGVPASRPSPRLHSCPHPTTPRTSVEEGSTEA